MDCAKSSLRQRRQPSPDQHTQRGALLQLARRPWMILGLGRPELGARFPRLWADRHVQEIQLKPLSR